MNEEVLKEAIETVAKAAYEHEADVGEPWESRGEHAKDWWRRQVEFDVKATLEFEHLRQWREYEDDDDQWGAVEYVMDHLGKKHVAFKHPAAQAINNYYNERV